MTTKRKLKPKKKIVETVKKGRPVFMDDPTTEDVLKLNQAVEVVLMEPHLLSKPLYLWGIFIQAKVKKVVADYRARVKGLPDDEKYQKELSKFPMNADPTDVEAKLKKKFPSYFKTMKELWAESTNLEIEKAKSDWLKNCQNSSGVVSLAKIDMFDDLETLGEILYETE
jgi:hypothetical protein